MATPKGVEIFSVVTGPYRLLQDNPKPIPPDSYQVPAAAFEGEIHRGVRAFLAADKARPDGDEPPAYDYFDVNRRVSRAFAEIGQEGTIEKRLPITAQLPDPLLGAQYSLQFDRVAKFLHGTLPRRTITTLAGGIQNVEPPPLELSPFWRAWEAIEDPRVLLRDMGEHILVTDQVEVTRQLYPQIYAIYTTAMIEGLQERKTADQDWEPTMRQAQQIEVLLLVSRLSPELAADLQERARLAEQAERADEQASRSGGGGADPGETSANEHQTSTQKLTYR